MVAKCPSDNTAAVEEDDFFNFNDLSPHKIGWIVCGCAAAVTCLIALINILGHTRNYNRPKEQRQIIRVLLFPPVYAVVSFFSYRYFREYTYYELAEAAYEAFAIAAFLMLMLEYIGNNVEEQRAVFSHKDKKPLPFPFCCFRYRPSKAKFLVILKFSVVQYVFVRPALSVAGVITQYYQVYCSQELSVHYAYVYITAVDFVSISVALYGLIVLYVLIKEDLKGKRPLAKFLTIKLGIFLIFYQSFIFSMLGTHGVLHATEYWTVDNIADGLNALCTSCEMVLIAGLQLWAFNWREYHIDRVSHPNGKGNARGKTNMFMSLLHALNFFDILVEMWYELVFLFDRIRGKPYTRRDTRLDFAHAFGANDEDDEHRIDGGESGKPHGASGLASKPDQQYGMHQMQEHGQPASYGQGDAAYPSYGYATHPANGGTATTSSQTDFTDSTRSGGAHLRPALPAGAAQPAHGRPLSWEPQAM